MKLSFFKMFIVGVTLLALINILNFGPAQEQNLRRIKISHELHHQCINDEYNANLLDELVIPPYVPEPYEETVEYERELLDHGKPGQWRNMKILLDYSNMKTTDEYKTFISTHLINYSADFISNMYKVYPTNVIDELIHQNQCGHIQIPEDHRKHGVRGYDLVMYISAQEGEAGQHWLSKSRPCQLSKRNHRGVSGTITINLNYLQKYNIASLTTDQILQWQGVLMHEMTHILGFMSLMWDVLENTRGIKINSHKHGRSYITDKKVVEYSKKYWNCDDVFGAPLENNGKKGTKGSHWEKSSFSPELMTGSAVQYFAYTHFTALTLEATKWYMIDERYLSNFLWGKGEGCQFAKAKCVPSHKRSEFCHRHTPKGTKQCSHDYMGQAHCHLDKFATKCGLWDQLDDRDCRINQKGTEFTQRIEQQGGQLSGQSRCFDFVEHNNQPGCFVSKCEEHSITFMVNGEQQSCTKETKEIEVKIDGKNVSIRCPDRKRFCSQDYTGCKDQCNERGNCISGKCYCYAGFQGESCEQKQD